MAPYVKDAALSSPARYWRGALSWNLGWLKRADPEVMKQYIQKGVAFNEAAKAASPENPRVLWVVGGGQWRTP